MPHPANTAIAPSEHAPLSFRARRYPMARLSRPAVAPCASEPKPQAPTPPPAAVASASDASSTPTRRRAAYPPPPEGDASPRLTRNVREHCVMARVQRGGKRFQRNFTLARLGSWEVAEAQAAAWLNTLLAKLPHPTTSKGRLTRRNRSGVVGVSFQYDRHTLKSGRITAYPNYVAKWVGCASGVTWMCSTYGGEENAFLLACLCRRMQSLVRADVLRALQNLGERERQALLALRRPLPEPDLSSPTLATTPSAEGI